MVCRCLRNILWYHFEGSLDTLDTTWKHRITFTQLETVCASLGRGTWTLRIKAGPGVCWWIWVRGYSLLAWTRPWWQRYLDPKMAGFLWFPSQSRVTRYPGQGYLAPSPPKAPTEPERSWSGQTPQSFQLRRLQAVATLPVKGFMTRQADECLPTQWFRPPWPELGIRSSCECARKHHPGIWKARTARVKNSGWSKATSHDLTPNGGLCGD